jgi:hypothetical protein
MCSGRVGTAYRTLATTKFTLRTTVVNSYIGWEAQMGKRVKRPLGNIVLIKIVPSLQYSLKNFVKNELLLVSARAAQ